MYLKSLEICGFKSFPKKTVLTFESGITIVVGPNGCGKSNVLDAIRWGLGEQSPKSLRGAKMEDVIFGGTEKLPAFNFAEVTLTFSNPKRAMNVDFEEVSITRKLFRSGESEYYLNRSPVRKKDIQELLLSVGLGEGSYSFVAQGTIENILTAKPEDKRVIFDEASGILQFKDRKREVLRKLAETDENLVRLEDIITEIKRQRDSLQRQVQRAKRYREIQEELKEVEKNITFVKVKDISLKESRLQEELDKLLDKQRQENQILRSKKETLKNKEEEIGNLRKSQQEVISKSAGYESQIANLKHTIETNKQRINEFNQRLKSLEDNSTVYSGKVNEQQERIRQLKQERNSLDYKETESRNIIEQDKRIIEDKNSQNKERIRLIKENKEKLMQIETDKANLTNQLVDVHSQISSFSSRKKRLLIEVSKSNQEYKDQEQKTDRIREELNTITVSVQELTKNKESLLSKISSGEQDKAGLQKQREDREKAFLKLVSQLEFLKSLHMRYEDFPQAEEVTLTFNESFPDTPSVIVARIDKDSQKERSQGFLRIKTKAKVISQGIEQLDKKKEVLHQAVDSLKSQIEDIDKTNSLLYEQQEKDNAELQEKERQALRLKEVEKNQQDNLQRLQEEKELFEFELKEAEEELNTFNSRQEELKNKQKDLDSKIEDIQKVISDSEEEINNNKNQSTKMEMEIARLSALLESLEEEKKTKENTISVFSNDLETMVSQLDTLEKENVELKDKINNYLQQNQEFSREIEAKIQEGKDLRNDIEAFQSQQERLISEQKEISGLVSDVQEQLNLLSDKVYDRKLKMQNLSFEKNKVISDLKQLYEVEFNIEDVNNKEEDFSFNDLVSKEEDLKRKLKYLGNVNMGALEEYEELNQRFEFLEAQREDLVASKESLRKAIAKINKTSRTMFTEMFTKIQEEFRKLFRFLFGGGKAEIFLLDPDNVLDSGIDIVVQPPEKKLQNVNLLSGGEKSLTATALIFSIFKIKPSPLCILDEIDAPLDESNVDRFNHVLSEFSQKSQFIVISHNKKTISQADVMYGVTMQESGVSRIVSVKFKEHSPAGPVSNPTGK
jgi:chromosome segregation protein